MPGPGGGRTHLGTTHAIVRDCPAPANLRLRRGACGAPSGARKLGRPRLSVAPCHWPDWGFQRNRSLETKHVWCDSHVVALYQEVRAPLAEALPEMVTKYRLVPPDFRRPLNPSQAATMTRTRWRHPTWEAKPKP